MTLNFKKVKKLYFLQSGSKTQTCKQCLTMFDDDNDNSKEAINSAISLGCINLKIFLSIFKFGDDLGFTMYFELIDWLFNQNYFWEKCSSSKHHNLAQNLTKCISWGCFGGWAQRFFKLMHPRLSNTILTIIVNYCGSCRCIMYKMNIVKHHLHVWSR